MHVIATLAQHEIREAGVSDAVYTHHVPAIDPQIPPDLLQGIERIPSAFKGYDTGHWKG